MGLVAALASGELGVKLVVPKRMAITDETASSAALVDQDRTLAWHLSLHEYRLDLQPEHRAVLERDVERHARHLFETFFHHPSRPVDPDAKPRTADPTWSPVVSNERVRCGEHDALSVIHRMTYARGDELGGEPSRASRRRARQEALVADLVEAGTRARA